MKTIKELAAELDAKKAEVSKAQAALDKAREAVEIFGEEPPVGSLIRFEVRLPSSGLFTYAALRVADKGWYLTGNLGASLMLSCSHGPHPWEFLCQRMEPGTMRVATGYSTSTLDAVPVKRTTYGPRAGLSLREARNAGVSDVSEQAEGTTFRMPLAKGEYFDGEGKRARSFLIGIDPADLAKSMRKTGVDPKGLLFEQHPDGTVRQVGEVPLISQKYTLDPASMAQVFADNQANPAGAAYFVRGRIEVRASKTSPGEESVTVHEVVRRGGDVVASFEGEDGKWQAAQSAAQRNRNAAQSAAQRNRNAAVARKD